MTSTYHFHTIRNGFVTIGLFFVIAFGLQIQAQSANTAAEEKPMESLLVKSGICSDPTSMMRKWFLARFDEKQSEWESNYEKVKTLEDVHIYQRARIEYFTKMLGQTWERTPLNAKVTGKLEKAGYRVEKIVFESIPGFYVTGTMFLPLEANHKGPYPGVLVPCGHSRNGKACDTYQKACALGAIHGLAMFIIDPIDQGERAQFRNASGKIVYTSHSTLGAGSLLLGRNTATFEIWDMMRAIDYLQSRPDVLPEKIGVMGNSGGGTQTAYIMALDPRVQAASPSCYICNLFDNLMATSGPHDAEQNIFGQVGFGMDHADYSIMRAPRPTLLCTATKDYFNIVDAWHSFRFGKRIYGRFGFGERMELVETDQDHGYTQQLREAAVRWMLRWLAKRDIAVTESADMPILTEKEIQCLPDGAVLGIPNAKSAYELNRELARELTEKRKNIWKTIKPQEVSELVRKVAGIRTMSQLPLVSVSEKTPQKDQFVLTTDPGIFLPVRSNIMDKAEEITIFISDRGRSSSKANELFTNSGKKIAAVDLRDWGETHSKQLYTNYYYAYLLGLSYVGMRTDDLLAVTRFFQKHYGAQKIHLIAEGYAATIALHAAAVEPQMFKSVLVDRADLKSWNEQVEAAPGAIVLSDTIHGVLNDYDLTDLFDFVTTKKQSPQPR